MEVLKKTKRKVSDVTKRVQSLPASFRAYKKRESKKQKYNSFQLQKRIRVQAKPLPSSWQLIKESLQFFKHHASVFLWIIMIHTFFYFVLVYGSASINVRELQDTLQTLLGTQANSIESTTAVFGSVITAQTQREGAAIYNFLLFLIMSLATIWSIRRIVAGKTFLIRDAFYSGMRPAIPFIIILMVMFVQLIPFMVTSYVYTVGRGSGIFVSGVEDMLFFLLALTAGLLSFYWLTTSILSLYAVTLPNMYPLRTLRLTKKVTQFRRFLVFRRLIALPFIIALVFMFITLLAIRFLPQTSLWVVQLFPIFILPLIHIYLFKLYKSLL